MTREARKVRKSTATTHRRTERILPVMLASKAVRRPKWSDRWPMIGDAMAWRREKRLPRAPPSNTISYLDSIGRRKAAL
jgi:hypothetical protein